MDLTFQQFLFLSAVLFLIGVLGVMIRRNLIMILLSIEIMLNAANLALVSGSSFHENADGQVLALFLIAIAACEVALGLAIAVLLFKGTGSVQTDHAAHLKG